MVSVKHNGTALFGKSEDTKLNLNYCPLLLEIFFLLNQKSDYTAGSEQQWGISCWDKWELHFGPSSIAFCSKGCSSARALTVADLGAGNVQIKALFWLQPKDLVEKLKKFQGAASGFAADKINVCCSCCILLTAAFLLLPVNKSAY